MRYPITEATLRPLTEADAEDYREHRLLMLKESPTAFGADLAASQKRPLSYFQARTSDVPDNFIVGAFAAGRLVGSVGGFREQEAKRLHIANVVGMYVHPDYRARGLGQRLLGAVLARLSQLPELEIVQLAVTAGNDSALRLYEAAGFEVYGREPAALKVAGVNYDELLLSLELPVRG